MSVYEQWLEERGNEVANLPRRPGFGTAFDSGARLAEPMTRLLARLVDGLAFLVAMLPGLACMVAGVIVAANTPRGSDGASTFALLFFGGFILMMIGFLLMQVYPIVLLTRYGQTIGKRYLRIKIVMMGRGGSPGFVHGWLLRTFIPELISSVVGVFGLIDAAFIFSEDRRCIHDLLAGTKVVEA